MPAGVDLKSLIFWWVPWKPWPDAVEAVRLISENFDNTGIPEFRKTAHWQVLTYGIAAVQSP